MQQSCKDALIISFKAYTIKIQSYIYYLSVICKSVNCVRPLTDCVTYSFKRYSFL